MCKSGMDFAVRNIRTGVAGNGSQVLVLLEISRQACRMVTRGGRLVKTYPRLYEYMSKSNFHFLVHEDIIMSLHKKTILITGASRGIGRAMAVRFARDGANVGLLARSLDRPLHTTLEGCIQEVACKVAEVGGIPRPIRADLRGIDALLATDWVLTVTLTHREWIGNSDRNRYVVDVSLDPKSSPVMQAMKILLPNLRTDPEYDLRLFRGDGWELTKDESREYVNLGYDEIHEENSHMSTTKWIVRRDPNTTPEVAAKHLESQSR
jgi:hypothetical protein